MRRGLETDKRKLLQLSLKYKLKRSYIQKKGTDLYMVQFVPLFLACDCLDTMDMDLENGYVLPY